MDILSLSSLLKSVRNTPYPVMLANFATPLSLNNETLYIKSINRKKSPLQNNIRIVMRNFDSMDLYLFLNTSIGNLRNLIGTNPCFFCL